MCRCMQAYPAEEIHHVHRDERSSWSQEKKVLSRQPARGRSSRIWIRENQNGMDSRFEQSSTSLAKWLCGESRMGEGWRMTEFPITYHTAPNWTVKFCISNDQLSRTVVRESLVNRKWHSSSMDPDKKPWNERGEGEEQRNTDNDKEDSSNWPKIAAPTLFFQFLL